MGIIKIDHVKTGMVLSESVKDHRGRNILDAGVELVEKNIMILKMWGVTEIDIGDNNTVDHSENYPGEADASNLMKVQEELHTLFQFNDLNHPAIAEMFRLCTKRFLLQQCEGKLDG